MPGSQFPKRQTGFERLPARRKLSEPAIECTDALGSEEAPDVLKVLRRRVVVDDRQLWNGHTAGSDGAIDQIPLILICLWQAVANYKNLIGLAYGVGLSGENLRHDGCL